MESTLSSNTKGSLFECAVSDALIKKNYPIYFYNNKETLRGLVASIMNFSPETIKDVTIENPIVIGDAMSNKEYRLDILVTLNSSATLNIEMQINNYSD